MAVGIMKVSVIKSGMGPVADMLIAKKFLHSIKYTKDLKILNR